MKDKICINCKYCEIQSPSTGLCELGNMLVEVKYSYCENWEAYK